MRRSTFTSVGHEAWLRRQPAFFGMGVEFECGMSVALPNSFRLVVRARSSECHFFATAAFAYGHAASYPVRKADQNANFLIK